MLFIKHSKLILAIIRKYIVNFEHLLKLQNCRTVLYLFINEEI